MKLGRLLSLTVLALLPALSHAQQPAQGKPVAAAAEPAARPADVNSLEGMLLAVYDVISGPAGDRDWTRFRSLFIREARFIPTSPRPDGKFGCDVADTEGFIGQARQYFKDHSFYEREVSRKVESFGSITHVFSTYESRETPNSKPFERGINSIQLFHDGSRWWVVTIYWDRERPGNPIPARYLETK